MSGATFPDYQQSCGWNALLPPRGPARALEEDLRCDVAIVGAGYTGLAAARRSAELQPGARIAIVDSSEVGEATRTGWAALLDAPTTEGS